jgi:electron transfer flavoprotein alpha/beta subunit
MGKRTTLKRAITAGLLSATISTPAVLGLNAGPAAARPIESPNCRAIAQAVDSSIHMAHQADLQGDQAARDGHLRDAARAHANYNRKCL